MYFPEVSPVERLSFAQILHKHISHAFRLCKVWQSASLTGVLYLDHGFVPW